MRRSVSMSAVHISAAYAAHSRGQPSDLRLRLSELRAVVLITGHMWVMVDELLAELIGDGTAGVS
jgi:hypothetical protein